MIESRLDRTPVEPAFSLLYPFPLDPFQIEAIDHIRDGRSVMVAAPTSSGKTVVAEYALWRALQQDTRAIYTTPIKALSNQKRRDLEAMFPGQIGLLTGDRSENPDAPIVVMTTEVLRNMLVEDPESLHWVGGVVFDEVHYLADPDRGTVWEESIITCPKHVQLICLSATIANAEEIAAWIGETHREIALVRHDERPVPLEHYYFTGAASRDDGAPEDNRRHHRPDTRPSRRAPTKETRREGAPGALHLVRDAFGRRHSMFLHEGKLPEPHPADVIRAMARADLLPAIWFAFSRRGVEQAAEACVLAVPRPNADEKRRIEDAVAWTLASLPEEDRYLPQLSSLVNLLKRGVGFHHAGLLPPLKELVERLFTEGLLSVVCATDTLAVGINMPARTVVISCLSRPFGGMLTPNEFQQLTGRAGRRGIDERGAAVMLPSPYHPFEQAYREVSRPLEPVQSAFRLRYSTLLSAMEGNDDERLQWLVRSSLRQYQMKAAIRRARGQLDIVHADLALVGAAPSGGPPGTGSHDGELDLREYLALQAELSAAEKEQQRARKARSKMPSNRNLVRRHERARERRESLAARLRSHAWHARVGELEVESPERLALLRRVNKLEANIRQAQAECDQDAAATAEAVRNVLRRLGYVGKRGLTRKAYGLREIVAAGGIVLTELYEDGRFDRLDPAALAEVMSWFACDAERRKRNHFRLPHHHDKSGGYSLQKLRMDAFRAFDAVAGIEAAEGIELAQGPSYWFYGVAYAWCRGSSLEEILTEIDLSEGDIVSLLNKTVDLLDQFESMLIRYQDMELLAVATEARKQLVRGLVAMVRSN